MKSLTRRQQKQIKYFLRDKVDRQKKDEQIREQKLPTFMEQRQPYIRRLARNLDQIIIVDSFHSPELKPHLIDRYLVLAEIENRQALICLNKTDLLENQSEAEEIAALYRSIGYDVLLTSTKSRQGIEELSGLLQGKRSAFAGHSGVGKSSLLNAVSPELQVEVSEISEQTNKGRHTTTQIKIFTLGPLTEVIDLPGIKVLDFIDIHKSEARAYYREFQELNPFCKFSDCLHISEEPCAVKQAVAEGIIDPRRYASYLKFVESLQ